MANTLTNLIPTIREALDTVSRELIGFIPAVWRNPEGRNLTRAAKGETIRFPITPAAAAADIAPGQLPPDTGDQVIGSDTLTISKSRAVPVRWNGEEQLSLSNGDRASLGGIMTDQFAQAFRTLSNEIETDMATLYTKASRASGVAATLPFTTPGNLSDFANSAKVLKENGAPMDWRMVLGNVSAANLMSLQSVLFKVNEAGSSELLRNGSLGRVQGFNLYEANSIIGHTLGDGASYTSSTAGHAIGSTDIAIITGTGDVLAGDHITFAGDSNKYMVTTGVAAPGTITIAEPGLKIALPTSAVALTVGGTSAEQNMYFDRNAIVLVSRLPALPEGGDSATDRMVVQDPFSGLAFEVAMYREYRQIHYEISLAWGYKMVKPAHSGVLLA